ncbi:MAG TPA: long-chain fatty acid--CoA ligase [Streptosporangiaceae bacterium]|nr:long-chain fatty acid--CoA ligase [Streptosporangiaceae bacterium]
MREYTTPAAVEIPASARLTDIVFTRAQDSPGTVVIRRRPGTAEAGWRDVTAAAFRDDVAGHAKGLIASGIGAGDRVALMSRTRYEWTVADYAIWAAGAVTVPVYETSSAEQVEWILTDSGARAIVVETAAHLAGIAEVLGRLPDVSRIWLIDPGAAAARAEPAAAGAEPAAAAAEPTTSAGPAAAAEPFAGLPAAGAGVSDADLGQRRMSVGAADVATIIYTSGTTGRPKGCVITHGNLLASARNAVTGPLSAVFRVPGASTLLFLPLAHSFARIIEVGVMEAGAVLGHTPDVSNLLPDLAGFRPTFLLAVPRVFEKVYNGAAQQAAGSRARNAIFQAAARTAIAWSSAYGTGAAPDGAGPLLRLQHAVFDRLVYTRLRAAIGGQVSHAVSGGAPLGERLGHFFRGAGITILEGYGLTETTAPATVNPPDRNKIGTVGQPLPAVSVRIAEDGEILIAGPNVFAGYLHNEAATAETLTPDGWLRSGDIGELDDEGYLRVTGRKKELIVTAGGKNVSPAVLEDRIRAHPLVSQCLVVGDGRPYVACLITLDPEAVGPWLARHGRPAGTPLAELAADKDLLAELQGAVDEANRAVSRAESVRRFRVLTTDFTEQAGYLTPSLKIRRHVVLKDFADEIDALYA